jgi:hypothetical protein
MRRENNETGNRIPIDLGVQTCLPSFPSIHFAHCDHFGLSDRADCSARSSDFVFASDPVSFHLPIDCQPRRPQVQMILRSMTRVYCCCYGSILLPRTNLLGHQVQMLLRSMTSVYYCCCGSILPPRMNLPAHQVQMLLHSMTSVYCCCYGSILLPRTNLLGHQVLLNCFVGFHQFVSSCIGS